nr:hypothetical protein [Bradyrhizobium sp. A19]
MRLAASAARQQADDAHQNGHADIDRRKAELSADEAGDRGRQLNARIRSNKSLPSSSTFSAKLQREPSMLFATRLPKLSTPSPLKNASITSKIQPTKLNAIML